MNIPTTAPAARTRSGARRRLVRAVCGGVCAVGAVAGIAAWATAHQGSTTARRAAAPQPVHATAVMEPTHDDVVSAPTYYLVASPDQAATMRQQLRERNQLRFLNGERELTATVMVVQSLGEEAHLRRAIDELTDQRMHAGLPGVRVVDLRTP